MLFLLYKTDEHNRTKDNNYGKYQSRLIWK